MLHAAPLLAHGVVCDLGRAQKEVTQTGHEDGSSANKKEATQGMVSCLALLGVGATAAAGDGLASAEQSQGP